MTFNVIIYFVTLVSILNTSCEGKLKQANKQKTFVVDTVQKQKDFRCFESIDTTQFQETKACSGYYYKKIKNKFVLEIRYDSIIQFDSCIHVYIDTINSNKFSKLFTYKDGDASLFIFCNDYGDDHVPITSSDKAFGDFYIRFYKSHNNGPTVSIWINTLTFIDPKSGQKTTISNELLWKIEDLGFYGG